MDSRRQLIETLADGRFHSGRELGEALGVGRAMVWKQLRAAREDLGLQVHGVAGKGYRLAFPVALLSAEGIREALAPRVRGRVADVRVALSVDSTNRRLLEAARAGAPGASVLAAEHQSGGRGRRGRRWSSPFGHNLYLSLLWRCARLEAPVAAASIAAGVAAARALEGMGLRGVGLKWPNDLHAGAGKLAGILLEMGGEPAGPCHLVVGVGVNVNMTRATAPPIDQPWTSLRELCGEPLDRSRLAGALVTELVLALEAFAHQGLAAVLGDWERLDLTRGRSLGVHTAAGVVEGTGRGIDESGALRVATAAGLRVFHSGEVSVRIGK